MKENILKITESLKKENSKINKLLPFFIILLFILLNTLIVFKLYNKDKENNEIVRLHVVANSNLLEDQIVKLKVNEKINEYIANLNNKKLTSEEILENIKENIADILSISNEVIVDNNLNYTASANIGKIYYEKKQSMLLDMNKGNYNSVQIILGQGDGKNIWTLISPSKENLKNISFLNTIFPGIDKLYEENIDGYSIKYEKDNIYTFKIVESLKNIQTN